MTPDPPGPRSGGMSPSRSREPGAGRALQARRLAEAVAPPGRAGGDAWFGRTTRPRRLVVRDRLIRLPRVAGYGPPGGAADARVNAPGAQHATQDTHSVNDDPSAKGFAAGRPGNVTHPMARTPQRPGTACTTAETPSAHDYPWSFRRFPPDIRVVRG